MENEEERHKFKAKRTSDEKVINKTVKPGARVSICGLQGSICGPKESRQTDGFSLTS
jgi:hypothetical protein